MRRRRAHHGLLGNMRNGVRTDPHLVASVIPRLAPEAGATARRIGGFRVAGLTPTVILLAAAFAALLAAPSATAGSTPTIKVTWQPVTVDDGGRGSIRAIIRGGPGFVAVGRRAPGTTAAIWTSADGHTWRRAEVGEATDAAVSDVTRYGDGYVAVGTAKRGQAVSPAVWTSTDGLTWSRVRLDLVHQWPDERGGGDRYRLVAVGCTAPTINSCDSSDALAAAAWVSNDGTDWTPAAVAGGANTSMRGVSTAPEGFVSVGDEVQVEPDPDPANPGGVVTEPQAIAFWRSPDGADWTRIAVSADAGAEFASGADVARGPDGLVAVGGGNGFEPEVWASTTGEKWDLIEPDLSGSGEGSEMQAVDRSMTGGSGPARSSVRRRSVSGCGAASTDTRGRR